MPNQHGLLEAMCSDEFRDVGRHGEVGMRRVVRRLAMVAKILMCGEMG